MYHYRFPSPCGEKVGINADAVVAFWDGQSRFPSPCGEKVGINLDGYSVDEIYEEFVSVPLRGKGRDQLVELFHNNFLIIGFRPLAGKR